MATKEDRYPKEYKPFHNDKPISSSQSSRSNNSKQHPDFKDALKSTISRHMKGFRATNVITYKRFRDKSTWQRPGEFAELVATDDEDVFTADPKEAWPIMQDMNIDIPVKELTKQHRVVDRNWTAPVSNKKFKQPEPIYPQSTGVKLRNVEDIMNDYSKKAPQTTAPSLSLASSSNATKSLTPNANSIPRVTDKSQRPLQLIPDKIKGVLQNLTDTRRKPAAATPPTKSHSNSSSNNTPRKSSTLKSSAISPKDTKIKKQSTPTITTTDTKPAYPATRPRISSKTIPMEKVIQIDNIPDLMEARKYLVGDDEVEFRSLSSLQEMPKDIQVKERPQLYFRLYPKPDEHDMPKGLKQHIALASVNKNKIKQEKLTSLPSTKNQTKTSTKSTPTSLPSDSTSKTVGKSNSKKQSQSDQSQAPIRTSTTKSKKPIKIKEEGEEPITSTATPTTNTSTKSAGTSSEKQAYASSVSVEFLRSTKIPKRNNSTNKSSSSSHDMELEEGETISPSPSPIRTKARSSHADVDDESSNIERPASTISRKASTSKRRDEDRSNRDRERDRDRYRDESTSSSRRERSHRHRSKSRSRSPVNKNHRSESRSRRSSPPSRRQTSSESSHRRRSPTARSERDNTRSEKESFIASVTTTNVASARPEKETSRSDRETSRPDKESTSSVSRAERLSDRSERPEKSERSERSEKSEKLDKADRETSGRETKRKSLHDSDSKTTNEPPTKRISTKNKDEKPSNNTNSTSTTSTIEKDTKYTNNSNQVSNSSSSSSSKNVKKPAVTTAVAAAAAINVVSTPKSVSTPNTAASISSSTSSSTTITAVNAPDKVISATAPNAETPEQYKIFTIMFKQLAHANKRRGDTQKNPVIGIIDHFHALCDYMLNFYFVDKVNTNIPFKQASVAWKSLFPFSDSLLSKLQANHLHELYGLCVRLVALIRYYIYSRMESATRPLLTKHLSGSSNQDSYTDRTCIEMTEGLLREHEKAEKCYNDSEKYMTFGKVASQFPGTFKDVCIDGNILAGITLGGEAGVSVGPMFPFTPYSPLHHAAIVSKCILNEYVTKNNLKYSPITKPEEFM